MGRLARVEVRDAVGDGTSEYDGNNRLVHKYIYGPGVDQPVCMIDVPDSNAAYYYHFDGLGSRLALSDADGNTAVVYEYDVYGQVAAVQTIPSHHNNQSSIINNQSQGPAGTQSSIVHRK